MASLLCFLMIRKHFNRLEHLMWDYKCRICWCIVCAINRIDVTYLLGFTRHFSHIWRMPYGYLSLSADMVKTYDTDRRGRWLPTFLTNLPRDTMTAISQTTFSHSYFLEWNVWMSNNILLKFVPKGQLNNIPALVQIIAWRFPCSHYGYKLKYHRGTILSIHMCIITYIHIHFGICGEPFQCIYDISLIEGFPW